MKALVRHFRDAAGARTRHAEPERALDPTKDTYPLLNYYRHKATTGLEGLYRFALQTRSVAIRDILAQVASTRNLNVDELVALIHEAWIREVPEAEKHLASSLDSAVLLVLADVLANAGLSDLDTSHAVTIYDFVYRVMGREAFSDSQLLRYIEALEELKEYKRADDLLIEHDVNQMAPLQTELLRIQRLRTTRAAIDAWLAALNTLYAELRMAEVHLLEPEDSSIPLMDRLTAGDRVSVDGPKVSIIMPTFSPGPSIHTAVRGLLQQTWQNLEILIVDDASSAEYSHVFNELEQLDPRIRVLHLTQNSGAYVARNAGLNIAAGTFVTTHDDDDWSHPDKIALQVRPLIENETLMATISAHIRATEHLDFKRVNAEAKLLQMNYSSLMFRKALVDDIGPWDTVNRGGDSEFYLRVQEYGGTDCILALSDKPLSLSRTWEGSLTSGEMSRGFFGYSRLMYRWSFRQWHRHKRERGEVPILEPQKPRPFPAPTTFEAGQRNSDLGTFDVIYVSDFFRQAIASEKAVNEMATLSQSGLRVGYVHLYSPETGSTFGFPQRLFDLQLQGQITQISHDDIAATRLLVVYDVSVGMFLDQIHSRIQSQRSIAIEISRATLKSTELRTPSYIPQALCHLDACFDTRFQIVGATPEDQGRIRDSVPASRVLHDELIWHPHVPQNSGRITVPTGKPVVGFHSNTNRYHWPNGLRQFTQVYLSNEFDTHFYGPVEKALETFGREILDEVKISDIATQSELDFLHGLDFWVYWPHTRLEVQIWEPVLSAMRAGKVVILPHSMSAIYGPAAVYVNAEQVSSAISYYSKNHRAYILQAEQAQAFVEKTYTSDSLNQRISNLLEFSGSDYARRR